MLDLDDFNALAVIRGQTYNADGILMEYTETKQVPSFFLLHETVTRRKDKLLDLALAGALSNEEFRQRNEACNEQLAALEQQRKELQNADKTLEQRIRRVESLRRTIEERWQTNCGFSREMSKALVDRIVVDADESRTCIRLEIFLSPGSGFRAEPVLSAATQSPDAQMKLTFPRSRSGHQGEYSVTYLVRWHLG